MLKQAAVCTLFEGHYHYGVAALINSLYKQGFRGNIYAGYRGDAPFWATFPESNESIDWTGAKIYDAAEGLRLHLLPVDTDYHLTNYKPDFMLRLWEGPAKEVEAMFYFDPDIVISRKWSFFNEWVSYGVTLCEDINSPLPERHPRRVVWRQYFGSKGVKLCFKSPLYANGGFVGVTKDTCHFLSAWQQMQELMALHIGGLNRSAFAGAAQLAQNETGAINAFDRTDQDALNATIEAWDGEVSFIGQEGMAFKFGLALMVHALGQPKPWNRKFLSSALKGKYLSVADKAFWLHTQSPICLYNPTQLKIKRLSISCATVMNRFYART